MVVEKIILAAVVFVTLCAYAIAHSWYDADCCSINDCYPVPADSVIEMRDGWKHIPTNTFFKDEKHIKRIRPSKDRSFHVCIVGDANVGYTGRCIYVLQGA